MYRTYPEKIDDIVRRDKEFEFLAGPRLGGSSFSSGVFRDKKLNGWLGKCQHLYLLDSSLDSVSEELDEERLEGNAFAEKIPNDIYAYYGAEVPETELSRQPLVNTGLEIDRRPHRYAVHVMLQFIPNAQPYSKIADFICTQPVPNEFLTLSDG